MKAHKQVRKLTPEQSLEIYTEYTTTDCTQVELAEKYGVTQRVISYHVLKHGGNLRVTRKIKPSQSVAIFNEYMSSDVTHKDLANKYNVSTRTIAHHISMHGGLHKSPGTKKIDDETSLSIYNDYVSSDISMRELAKRYGVCSSTIKRHINRHGGTPSNKKRHRNIGERESRAIFREYVTTKANVRELAKKHRLSTSAIRAHIHKHGGVIYDKREDDRLTTRDTVAIFHEYRTKGTSQVELAKKYNVSRGTIQRHILKAQEALERSKAASK